MFSGQRFAIFAIFFLYPSLNQCMVQFLNLSGLILSYSCATYSMLWFFALSLTTIRVQQQTKLVSKLLFFIRTVLLERWPGLWKQSQDDIVKHHEGESCEETQGPAKLGEERLKGINLHLDKDFRLAQSCNNFKMSVCSKYDENSPKLPEKSL